MSTTIDAGGRLVIPKPIRDALGLGPGVPVDVEMRDGLVIVVPRATRLRLEDRDGSPVATPEEPLPPLTAAAVREALDASRR